MKRVLFILLILVILVASFLLMADQMPKSASRFPVLFIVLVLESYLWFSLLKMIKKAKNVTKYALGTIYWLPLTALAAAGFVTLFVPVRTWDPALVTYLFGIFGVFFAGKLMAIVFFLLADLFKIIHFTAKFITSKKRKKPFKQEAETISRGRFLKNIGLAGGGLLFSGMIIGVVKWAYDFKVRRVSLRLPRLPRSFNGLRIVQISDLHLGSWASSAPLDEAVDLINGEDPDIVVFTGDLVNSTSDEALKFKGSLARIKARQGIFTILGNHDYGDYVTWPSKEEKKQNMQVLYDLYSDLGWNLLNNESYILSRGSEKLAILGVENWSSHKRFPSRGKIDKARKGTEAASAKILLSHDPTHWENVISKDHPDIDLTLSGHTHGFQFGVEWRGFKWSLAQYMYKYWAGLYSNGPVNADQYLYVNRGLGMIGYPGRVGILPEITVIDLEN